MMRKLLAPSMLALALAACSTTQTTQAPAQTEAKPVAPVAAAPAPVAPAAVDPMAALKDANNILSHRSVYFDFDKEEVKSEFQAIMACHAKYLRDRPSSRITLQGHTDERGSRAYNQALGERRGNAVNSALQGNGGSAAQLTVVSYGEERPVCTDSNESCWSQNRRVEIVYTAQ